MLSQKTLVFAMSQVAVSRQARSVVMYDCQNDEEGVKLSQ